MTRARSLSKLINAQSFTVDDTFNVGINSESPKEKLNVVGVVSATSFFGDGAGLTGIANTDIVVSEQITVSGVVTASSFVGDGSQITGVSGFATALSNDTTSVLNRFFKTPEEIPIGAGTSVSITSDDASGNVAFCREGNIHVAVGATFHVGSGTTLITNVLGVF